MASRADGFENVIDRAVELGIAGDSDIKAAPAVGDGDHARYRCRLKDAREQVGEGIGRRDHQNDFRARGDRMHPLNVEGRLGRPAGIGIGREIRFGRRANDVKSGAGRPMYGENAATSLAIVVEP